MVAKIDTFQGGERSRVLCDFTIVNTAGFLEKGSRVFAAISRAQNLLINFGNLTRIETITTLRQHPLKKFINKFRSLHCDYKWAPADDARGVDYLGSEFSNLIMIKQTTD